MHNIAQTPVLYYKVTSELSTRYISGLIVQLTEMFCVWEKENFIKDYAAIGQVVTAGLLL